MIEVLFSWSILMTTLLSLLTWQINSLKQMKHAYFYTLATIQLTSMAERLRVNRDSATRSAEKRQWDIENNHVLPQSRSELTCYNNGSICKISIYWQTWGEQSITETIAL